LVGVQEEGYDVDLDEATAQDLNRIFDRATEWRERVNTLPDAPSEGSSLAGDDRATTPYQLSHAVNLALFSAVDHIDALRSMIAIAGVIHSHAPFTLIRAVIENAATAVWLLAPRGRDERVLRRLRLQWADFADADQVWPKEAKPDEQFLSAKKERLQGLGRARGLSKVQISQIAAHAVSYSSIVATAGAEGRSLTEERALVAWRLSSGIAHARPWATLALLDHDEIQAAAEGVLNLRVTAPNRGLLMLAQIAANMIHDGWILYDERRTAAYR